jgi:hypothetical protein
MKYCQNPNCHYYDTNDRLKGGGENKTYQTRKASKLHFGNGNFCTQKCQFDWFDIYGNRAIDYFGRTITPKKRDKGTPNYWQIRDQVINNLYGNTWNNVDWARVRQEINNTINSQTN